MIPAERNFWGEANLLAPRLFVQAPRDFLGSQTTDISLWCFVFILQKQKLLFSIDQFGKQAIWGPCSLQNRVFQQSHEFILFQRPFLAPPFDALSRSCN